MVTVPYAIYYNQSINQIKKTGHKASPEKRTPPELNWWPFGSEPNALSTELGVLIKRYYPKQYITKSLYFQEQNKTKLLLFVKHIVLENCFRVDLHKWFYIFTFP